MRRSSDTSNEWLEEKTRNLRGGRPPRVEVFLRSFAPPLGVREQQERILEQLTAFERRGLVETVHVTVWGNAVCPDSHGTETQTGQQIIERVEELRTWGDRYDVDVETTFDERSVVSSVTDEEYQRIVLPRLCLGVYDGDELDLVLPCSVDETPFCVDDFLQTFERPQSLETGIGTSA